MNKVFNKRKIAAVFLAAAVLCAMCLPAMAANSQSSTSSVFKDDSVSINKTQVQSGKVNISDIKLTAKSSEKFLMIEKSAVEYAAEKGLNIGVTTNYMQITFPASVIVNSNEWQRATNASPGFNFVIELDDDYTFQNLSTALPSATRTKLGCTAFSPKGISVEMYLRGGNQSYVYINSLNTDMTLTYSYEIEYRNASPKPAEKSLALLWADVDRKFESTKVTDVLLKTKLDTKAKTMTVKTPYTCSAYMMVGQTNADNTQTVLAEQQTNTPGLTGDVNTKGVPAWAAASVAQMQEAQVVPSSLAGKNFSAPITRAEFAAYMARLLNVPRTVTGGNPFKDVSADNPYYTEILAAAKSGLVAGRDNVTFAPNANITRQEMAVMFSRALAFSHVDTSMEASKLDAMPDAAKIADWARPSATICVNSALIAGKEGGNFAPQDNTSWTEAVVMLARLAGYVHK